MISHSKPCLGTAEKKAIDELLNTSLLSAGEKTRGLEQMISKDTGYSDSIAVSSASIAIYVILKYRFSQGGAKVALSSYICRSIWDAVKMANCVPVLYDVDPDTLAIDINQVKRNKIDIAIVAHMFGVRAHFEKLQNLGIEVIEDCAQRICPTFIKTEPKANWRVYSFDPTKIITCGQGGVISGLNKEQMQEIRKMIGGEYDYSKDCIKAPFTDLQAAIALVQWERLNEFLEKRKKIAVYYTNTLYSYNLQHIIHPSMLEEDTWHFRYVIKVDFPDQFIREMEDHGIVCRKPLQPFGLHKLFNVSGLYFNTEWATEQLLSLPIYPALSQEEVVKVIYTFMELYGKHT